MASPPLIVSRQDAIEVAQLAKQWSTVIVLANKAGHTDAEVPCSRLTGLPSLPYPPLASPLSPCGSEHRPITMLLAVNFPEQISRLALLMAKNLRGEATSDSKRAAANLLVRVEHSEEKDDGKEGKIRHQLPHTCTPPRCLLTVA